MNKSRKVGPLRVRPHIRNGVPTGKWFLDIPASITGTGNRREYVTRFNTPFCIHFTVVLPHSVADDAGDTFRGRGNGVPNGLPARVVECRPYGRMTSHAKVANRPMSE